MDLHTLIKLTDYEHSRKVSQISALLAEIMGYSRTEVEIIKEAALYHDIGKIDIAPEILNKPGALTSQEFDIVKKHTQLGCEKIKDAICGLIVAYWAAKNHHERLDGSGYQGLTADEIHPFIRLISAVDVLDALVSRRAYKQCWGMNDALAYLQKQAGVLFDKEVVSALMAHSDDVEALYR